MTTDTRSESDAHVADVVPYVVFLVCLLEHEEDPHAVMRQRIAPILATMPVEKLRAQTEQARRLYRLHTTHVVGAVLDTFDEELLRRTVPAAHRERMRCRASLRL